ncbi:MAG: ROK family protein [Chloroflexi bacterium]|nr:ROK family protein [Chloroflexota bacterium]
MESLLLALDFGGTKHSAALLRRGDTAWLAQRRAAAPPAATAETDVAVMLTLVSEMLGEAQPAAVGVSFGGPVSAADGVVKLSHHVPGWEDFPLRALLQSRLGAPVAIDNDANMGALGEWRFGAGRDRDSLLYVTVSTGVGGGWVLGGRVWRGADGMAGEIGHTVIDPSGPLCLCGKRGCVERYASGPYLAEDARELLSANPDAAPILRSLIANDIQRLTAQHVAEAASLGDTHAIAAIERAGRALGVAIGNAANLMNPSAVVLAGGVTKAGDSFWQSIRSAARRTALPQVSVDILPALNGDDAPLWGAIAQACDLLDTAPPHG